MLQTPGKQKELQAGQASFCQIFVRERCKVKLIDGSLKYVNPRVADTHRALMAVSEVNDMRHDVFFTRND